MFVRMCSSAAWSDLQAFKLSIYDIPMEELVLFKFCHEILMCVVDKGDAIPLIHHCYYDSHSILNSDIDWPCMASQKCAKI